MKALFKEIAEASSTLKGISSTWNEHRKIIKDQVAAGSHAWKGVDGCLKETKETLEGLRDLVKGLENFKIKDWELRDVWKKPALALRLRHEKDDIEDFKRRIEKHNLQFVALLHIVQL